MFVRYRDVLFAAQYLQALAAEAAQAPLESDRRHPHHTPSPGVAARRAPGLACSGGRMDRPGQGGPTPPPAPRSEPVLVIAVRAALPAGAR